MTVPTPEGATIRQLVLPRLHEAGWPSQSLYREYPITNGSQMVVDGRVRRGRPLRADIALMYGEHPIGVVEAKHTRRDEYTGVQQARQYATRLDLPVAYATNGHKIIEIDMRTQSERTVDRFRSPEELWAHFRGTSGLESDLAVALFNTPYNRKVVDGRGQPKSLRYYQHVAVQRLLRRIAGGDRRLLAVLATGTGKTGLATQLVHVLWQNYWPRGAADPDNRPRVLYLADRDVLITQPLRDWFRPAFLTTDDPTHRVAGGFNRSKHLYFALYQALDQGSDRAELFRRYDPDWFDLIIVDECHRGSAAETSAWRAILDHFSPAVQLGLTATPAQAGEVDTYAYFGNPVYAYSLKQGVEDGFLAPFEVQRVRLSVDLDGVEIPEGQLDVDGNPVPAGTYKATAFERSLILPERTQEAARYLTEHLRRTDRMGKTIVFCVDQNHAARMRESMVNLNADMMQADLDWAVRITSDEGDVGRSLLERFQDVESPTPVVATTSRLLSTGVDVPTAKNVVIFRNVESMTEFKQMIGRGTRLAPEYGKEYFTIIDVTGASRKFEDPTFDGPPIRVIDREADEDPPEEVAAEDDSPTEIVSADSDDLAADDADEGLVADDRGDDDTMVDAEVDPGQLALRASRHVVEGFDVYVASEALYVMDIDSGRLRRLRYDQWVSQGVRRLELQPDSLRSQWATVRGRKALRELLSEELLFDISELAARLNKPDCDAIDILIWLAWELPLVSRRERVDIFSATQRRFLDGYPPKARQILASLLDKYAAHGIDDLSPQALTTPPFSDMGSPTELAQAFGGAAQLHHAIDELGTRLLAAAA